MVLQTEMIATPLSEPPDPGSLSTGVPTAFHGEGRARWIGFRRILALIGAAVCLVLAAAGLVLPVLPTTPFVLLAGYLLLRSSDQLHKRLVRSRVFGGMLRDWEQTRSIARRTRNSALAVVFVCLTLTVLTTSLWWSIRAITLFAGSIGILVILRLPVHEPPSAAAATPANERPQRARQ